MEVEFDNALDLASIGLINVSSTQFHDDAISRVSGGRSSIIVIIDVMSFDFRNVEGASNDIVVVVTDEDLYSGISVLICRIISVAGQGSAVLGGADLGGEEHAVSAIEHRTQLDIDLSDLVELVEGAPLVETHWLMANTGQIRVKAAIEPERVGSTNDTTSSSGQRLQDLSIVEDYILAVWNG